MSKNDEALTESKLTLVASFTRIILFAVELESTWTNPVDTDSVLLTVYVSTAKFGVEIE